MPGGGRRASGSSPWAIRGTWRIQRPAIAAVGYCFNIGDLRRDPCTIHGVPQRRGYDERPVRLVQLRYGRELCDVRHRPAGARAANYAAAGRTPTKTTYRSLMSRGDRDAFCNWLQNGQPTGSEGPGTTESVANALNGATTTAGLTPIAPYRGLRLLPSVPKRVVQGRLLRRRRDECWLLAVPNAE